MKASTHRRKGGASGSSSSNNKSTPAATASSSAQASSSPSSSSAAAESAAASLSRGRSGSDSNGWRNGVMIIVAMAAVILLYAWLHYQQSNEQFRMALQNQAHGDGTTHGGGHGHGHGHGHAAQSMEGVRFPIAGNVRRIRWPADKPFSAEQVFLHMPREPVIISGLAEVDAWPARQWTPSSIAKNVHTLPLVYTKTNADNGIFGPIWIPDKPMLSELQLEWPYHHQLVNESSQSFFTNIATPPKGEYRYFVATIENINDRLVDDIDIWPLLLTPKRSQVNVWIGQPGVWAHLHYDSYYNLNVQLYGHKRFLLFPPSSNAGLLPYSFLHPSYGQSQLIDHASSSDMTAPIRHPNHTYPAALDAVLGPGDMLYIPPCWWHEVGAIDTSISVNAWSYTADTQWVEQIMELTRQAVSSVSGGAWTHELKRQVGYWLLRQVAERVLTNRTGDLPSPPSSSLSSSTNGWMDRAVSPTTASWLEQSLITERYADMLHRGMVPNHECYAPLQWWSSTDESRSIRAACPAHVTTGVALSITRKFRPFVTKIVSIFQKLPSDGQDLWVANYLENMAYWATSSTNLIAIIMQCAICDAHSLL